MTHTELLEVFERYALAAGAQVSVVRGKTEPAGVAQEAAAVVASNSPDGTITCTAAVFERYPALCKALEQGGAQVQVAEEAARDETSRSDIATELSGGTGIALARAGVAETGSVILADDALAPRLVSMLSDVCIVLLPSSAIVPGLDEAGALLAKLDQEGHRYISLVTGPSRTADIERVLTIGVQGPRALHIIVMGDG